MKTAGSQTLYPPSKSSVLVMGKLYLLPSINEFKKGVSFINTMTKICDITTQPTGRKRTNPNQKFTIKITVF